MDKNIVDVEYKEVIDLDQLTTEQLATETNTLWSQMEAIGVMGMQMAAEAGKRLNIVKDRLEYGTWETWCKDNLKFSIRKANRMMLLAEKSNDEESIFSNPTTLSDIGISKVWSLLSAPEEVAEEVVNEEGAADMTVKEFEEEIKRLKAENESIPDLESKVENLNKQIADAKKDAVSPGELEKLKKKLDSANNKLDRQKAEQDKAVEDAKNKGIEEGKKEAGTETKNLVTKFEEAQATIDKLKKQLAASSNQELTKFKVKSDILQKDFDDCLDSLIPKTKKKWWILREKLEHKAHNRYL